MATFNSVKDPEWRDKEKTSCVIIGMANYDWFGKYENDPCKRRSDAYEEIKNTIGKEVFNETGRSKDLISKGHAMLEQLCDVYPQMRDHIDYVEVASPLTNNHYLGHARGQFYGADHSEKRFDPEIINNMRPK